MRPVRRTQKPKRRYRYEDRNGRYITDSDITPDDCERPCESGPAGSDSSFRTAVAAHRPKQFSPPPAFFDGKIWRESEFLFTFALPKGSNNLLHRVQGAKAEDSEAAAENPDAGLPDNGPVW